MPDGKAVRLDRGNDLVGDADHRKRGATAGHKHARGTPRPGAAKARSAGEQQQHQREHGDGEGGEQAASNQRKGVVADEPDLARAGTYGRVGDA